ncbi:hypothetical protein [Bradyrhizobium diazoefficiens]|uniref:hypothetical protein n=1 Tax=Bradyrhizobium diazoefficiens TaxID=1355477 RepID=UPI002714AF33|nr:hypothetical protein [Bradyrhizobium diazoefficiens]WLC16287.1 hypothetical protein QIH76_40515 [Bradyrhizobium diazoefficiens]
MRKRTFLMGGVATLVGVFSATASSALNWPLVTQEEFDREVAEGKSGSNKIEAPTPPVSGAPRIEIKRPDPSQQIKVPVSIVVTFVPQQDAKIDLASFRATYGSFIKLDITEKIKANAKLDESGLSAENVSLPSGKHTVTISIADDKGRIGNRVIAFTVA